MCYLRKLYQVIKDYTSVGGPNKLLRIEAKVSASTQLVKVGLFIRISLFIRIRLLVIFRRRCNFNIKLRNAMLLLGVLVHQEGLS